MANVLVVEDDRSSRESLVHALEEAGLQVISAESGEEAIARLKLSPADVVITDVMMGRVSGMDLLTHINEHHADTAVILATGFGTIEAAVEAMRQGAYDYITKPINIDHLELLVNRAFRKQNLLKENRKLRQELRRRFSVAGIVGQSSPIRRVLEQIEQVAPTNATVLVLGESGTGKELVAGAIHHNSRRSDGPLVSVNCVALAESLIESELFGHERGAFTGAHKMRRGRFELATHGTLFLDEVGDLAVGTQLKLLRAIQERQIERVGGTHPIPVDVRLIAATNQDLEQKMRESSFREELYYRLKVVTISIPPLRERTEDIPLLLNHFLSVFCEEHGKQLGGFSLAAMSKLTGYSWPGNVRELRNMVESLVVTARGEEVTVQQLPASLTPERSAPTLTLAMGHTLSDIDRTYILRTLDLLGGNKSRAAQVLGIGKKTLYRRLQEYGVDTSGASHGDGMGGQALEGTSEASEIP